MKTHVTEIRVPYADTDQMGTVYYANYLVYFERGRTEWLRAIGVSYKDLEGRGVLLPVMESTCVYHAPARYDDVLAIHTSVAESGFASMVFSYEIKRAGTVITTGTTKHPFVNREFKPIRVPREIQAILAVP